MKMNIVCFFPMSNAEWASCCLKHLYASLCWFLKHRSDPNKTHILLIKSMKIGGSLKLQGDVHGGNRWK